MSMIRYPSYLFRDPLLLSTYLQNTRVGTPIIINNIIDINVEGDHLLNLYITHLDKEIYQKIPEGLETIGEAFWAEDDWAELAPKIADEARKHGWCMVKFYDEEFTDRWKVFSVQEFTTWIKETKEIDTDENGDPITKVIRMGGRFKWADDLGNALTEELRFDDDLTYMITWRKGDGRETFAYPDLTQALMTLIFEFRQAKGQMLFSAAKPSFKHFVYGEGANDDNVKILDVKIKGIDNTSGLGVNKTVLEEIRTIKDESLPIIEPALNKQLQFISGLTRMPVSFFMGEKQTSGMSDMGEKTDMLKIRQKKESIFNTFAPSLITMMEDIYNITIKELVLPQDETLEEIEEDEQKTKTNLTNKNIK